MADQLRLKVLLEALDRASAPMRRAAGNIGRGLAQVRASAEAASRAMHGVGKAGETMSAAGRSMMARVTLPVAALGGLTLKAAGDFEQGMLNVQALTGATGDQLEKLRDQAKTLGRTTQFSASQAADAMGFMAMAGMKAGTIYDALPSVLQLAAASGMDLASAADTVTNIMAGYNLTSADLGHANDVLVKAFTSANTNLGQLGEAMKYAGPIASGMGLTFEETAAALGLMGNAGIQASMAGTSLRGALSKLANPAKEARQALSRLKIHKRDLFDSEGHIVSLTKVIRMLQAGGADAADMLTIFGDRAGPAMQALVTMGADELERLTKTLQESGGTAARVAAVKMEGFNGQMRALKSAVEGAMLAIADSGLLEWATNLAKSLTALVQRLAESNPTLLKWGVIIAGVAAVAGPLLILVGQMALGIKGLVVAGAAARAALIFLGGGFGPVVAGIRAIGAALAANPIGLAILVIAELAYLLIANWSKVSAFFEASWKRIRAAFEKGFMQGIVQVLEEFDPVRLLSAAIDGLAAYLFGIDLAAAGRSITGSILAGIQDAWSGLVGWLAGKVADLLGKLDVGIDLGPLGKVDTGLGDTIAQLRRLQAGSAGSPGSVAGAPPVAAGAAPAGRETKVGGTVKVRFENAPQGMRVQSVERDGAAVGLDVETGYAVAP